MSTLSTLMVESLPQSLKPSVLRIWPAQAWDASVPATTSPFQRLQSERERAMLRGLIEKNDEICEFGGHVLQSQ